MTTRSDNSEILEHLQLHALDWQEEKTQMWNGQANADRGVLCNFGEL